jgi:aminomethyltransferase
MLRRTPHFDAHIASGAKMVDFGGWEMPINYGSQIEEHHQVRTAAGMFDVSHMTVVDVRGARAREYLSYLLANDVAKLHRSGKALYGCMLNERGGVIDDLITYYFDESYFRLVVNATTREKVFAWMEKQAGPFDLEINEHTELAMLAVQGPEARAAVIGLLPDGDAEVARALKPFNAVLLEEMFLARTGYTGEDGFEISLADEMAQDMWDRLLEAGVKPCGLGARDTLRLEAGMNLYGQDMDETTTPLESGLGWTVAMTDDRQFIGRTALERQKAQGIPWRFAGFVLQGRGVLRHGQKIISDAGEGQLTSGSYSPTLQRAIGMGRVPAGATGDCKVDIRGKQLDVKVVKPPFVRNGEVCEGII